MKLGFDCKQVSRVISDGQDADLSVTDRTLLRLHLVMCDTCRNIEQQLAFLRQAMKRLTGDDPPAP